MKIKVFAAIISGLLLFSGCASGNNQTKQAQTQEAVTSASGTSEAGTSEADTSAPDNTAAESDTQKSPFEVLAEAKTGTVVTTGIDGMTMSHDKIPDNWYKFDEDDENIYLIYGDYYENAWLRTDDLSRNKLIREGIYGIGTDYSHANAERLLAFLTEEENWNNLKNAFEKVYPYRDIHVAGSPTKEQVEKASRHSDGFGYTGNPNAVANMFRPHLEVKGYAGCNGYWLATMEGRDIANLYGVRCNWNGINLNRVTNADYAVRPLITVPKAERAKNENEIKNDKAKEDAAKAQEHSELLQLGDFTLSYGKYTGEGSDASTLYLNADGTIKKQYDNDDTVYEGQWRVTAENGQVFLEITTTTFDSSEAQRFIAEKDNVFRTAWRYPTVYTYAEE